ncbi:MAG: cysteine desulfurase [Candidatus Eremiobacteraeota bacterium]|nr:cysteine desulfurase [Candidatus Eremiobacteraeota bacterium]
MNSEIYLDHAATAPLRREVGDEMLRVEYDAGFNPSSLHAPGRRARALLDDCRDRVATQLGAARTEVIFTSGGTESNNHALLGIAANLPRSSHILTSAIEHHSVLATLEYLTGEGFEITRLSVGRGGHVAPERFAEALRPHTRLVSLMYANNEIGAVQPVARLAAMARARGIFFHCDAVQAPCWLPIRADDLGVDALSLSAHKFAGPKGLGVLYVRSGVPLSPILHGGGQESGRRSGTENLGSIVGAARALELACEERQTASATVRSLRDWLEARLLEVTDAHRNGAEPRLPNVINCSFDGIQSAELLIALDLAGIAASAGSACAAGALEPSHVLGALELPLRRRRGAIRLSLGPQTRRSDVERVADIVPKVVAKLRAHSPAA